MPQNDYFEKIILDYVSTVPYESTIVWTEFGHIDDFFGISIATQLNDDLKSIGKDLQKKLEASGENELEGSAVREIITNKENLLDVTYNFTADNRAKIEYATKGQSVNKVWYLYRRGLITVSKSHEVSSNMEKF